MGTEGRREGRQDGVTLRGETDDLQWMARCLSEVGALLTIRNPPELRAALRRMHRREGMGYRREIAILDAMNMKTTMLVDGICHANTRWPLPSSRVNQLVRSHPDPHVAS